MTKKDKKKSGRTIFRSSSGSTFIVSDKDKEEFLRKQGLIQDKTNYENPK